MQAGQTLADLVAWQNTWLTERLEFLRTDLRYYLDTREPATEEDYRRLLQELALTQQLLLQLPTPPMPPDELLRQLRAVRQQWEAQFPEASRAVVRHLGGH